MTADAVPAGAGKQPIGEQLSAGVGNVDKIRDILFGSQMQDYERRFERLEKRVDKSIADLREDATKRLDALERYTRKEIEALLTRVTTEADSRTEADRELARELAETGKKLRQLTDSTTTAQRELRKEILEQSKSLRDEIRVKNAALSKELATSVAELSAEKVARVELAGHLVEIAKRLGAEATVKSKPGSGESGDS